MDTGATKPLSEVLRQCAADCREVADALIRQPNGHTPDQVVSALYPVLLREFGNIEGVEGPTRFGWPFKQFYGQLAGSLQPYITESHARGVSTGLALQGELDRIDEFSDEMETIIRSKVKSLKILSGKAYPVWWAYVRTLRGLAEILSVCCEGKAEKGKQPPLKQPEHIPFFIRAEPDSKKRDLLFLVVIEKAKSVAGDNIRWKYKPLLATFLGLGDGVEGVNRIDAMLEKISRRNKNPKTRVGQEYAKFKLTSDALAIAELVKHLNILQ